MSEASRKPFLLRPAGKDYLWGGSRLKDDFTKDLSTTPLAETWECSTHPDGYSIVASGDLAGKTLADILQNNPDYLGEHSVAKGELPLLIKLIDARENLSVQVHPDDEYARTYENGQNGKSEMWYVLAAAKDAELVYGVNRTVDKEELRKSIADGSIEDYLQYVPVKKGNVFFVEPGTIHAIGAGVMIVEIQENSNLTYRLYDYNRTDKNGKLRDLHIDKALTVANLVQTDSPRQPMRVLRYKRGSATELLCRCKYFEVHRLLLNTERCRGMSDYRADESSFRVLLCVDGCGSIFYGDGECFSFFKGDCMFFPSDSVPVKLHGKAELLDIRA